jgi:hypothetical protein
LLLLQFIQQILQPDRTEFCCSTAGLGQTRQGWFLKKLSNFHDCSGYLFSESALIFPNTLSDGWIYGFGLFYTNADFKVSGMVVDLSPRG